MLPRILQHQQVLNLALLDNLDEGLLWYVVFYISFEHFLYIDSLINYFQTRFHRFDIPILIMQLSFKYLQISELKFNVLKFIKSFECSTYFFFRAPIYSNTSYNALGESILATIIFARN